MMSDQEPSKARMRPEIVVSLIVAIIALVGTIGAAIISNMDKIWPDSSSASGPSSSTSAPSPSSSVSSATVASSPQPPPSPTPVNITGRWRNNFGHITDVIQQGDTASATATGIACKGPFNSTINGTITGNVFDSTYQSTYSTGRCRGTVSADGTRMTSSCSDSICGLFETTSVKIE